MMMIDAGDDRVRLSPTTSSVDLREVVIRRGGRGCWAVAAVAVFFYSFHK